MTNAFYLSLLLSLVASSTVGGFQSTHVVPKPFTRSIYPKVEPFNGHWSPTSSALINNENAFLRTPSSKSLSSLQSFFRSEAADSTTTATDRSSSFTGSKREYLKAASIQATSIATEKLKNASKSLAYVRVSEGLDQVLRFILQYWWSIPAFLALVPVYTTWIVGTGDAWMPHWWPVTRMDYILKSPDAAMVLSVFLGSNIAFFLGGGYLVKKFPFVKPDVESTTSTATASSSTDSSVFLGLKSRLQTLRIVPTRQTWLGILLLMSGLISTIFHMEQALGSFSVANSLCYLDHAVAGVSTFYFFHTCGKPSRKVWALGIAGLAALSIVPPHPLPGYAWLHSTWHLLAALAASLWAVESFDSPQKSPMVQPLPVPISSED